MIEAEKAAQTTMTERVLPFEVGVLDCTTVPQPSRCVPTITVPAGELFVLGDGCAISSDSAAGCRGQPQAAADTCARFARVDRVVGAMFARLWTLDDLGAVYP